MTLVTARGRSSFGKEEALALVTTPFTGIGDAITGDTIPVGLADANTVPVPSSLMVTVAGAAVIPPVLVAVSVNGSLLSKVSSCSGPSNTRTNALPLLSRGTRSPALYVTQSVPFQYSISVKALSVVLGKVNSAN